MDITITINNVDRTDDILIGSISKTDAINEEKDSLSFTVWKYADRGFIPEVNQDVVLTIDSNIEFGGVITNIKKTIKDGNIVICEVSCDDYTQKLDRMLIKMSFTNKTVSYIIGELVSNYATDFSTNNVDCDVIIETALFNRMTFPECLQKLSEATNYYWYVDYEKDIHFFAKETNVAPYSITDTNGKYIRNSLTLSDDLTQLRNAVCIRGGEERGEERTETYTGTDGQTTFTLACKFAELPVVNVDDSEVDVGVDNLDKEEDYDCFWSYEQKSLRFKVDMTGKKVEVTGIPLWNIIIKIPDPVSIAKYGTFEFFKEDKTITSKKEARLYAIAQLKSYKDSVLEGSFKTNTTGLRSGQIININSDLMGVDEDFVIQKITMKLKSNEKAEWSVKLATMRTVGIIELLQRLIRAREIKIYDNDNLEYLIQIEDTIESTDSCTYPSSVISPPYYYDDGGATPELNIGKWNLSTYV
jgi:hypothetical protein